MGLNGGGDYPAYYFAYRCDSLGYRVVDELYLYILNYTLRMNIIKSHSLH